MHPLGLDQHAASITWPQLPLLYGQEDVGTLGTSRHGLTCIGDLLNPSKHMAHQQP